MCAIKFVALCVILVVFQFTDPTTAGFGSTSPQTSLWPEYEDHMADSQSGPTYSNKFAAGASYYDQQQQYTYEEHNHGAQDNQSYHALWRDNAKQPADMLSFLTDRKQLLHTYVYPYPIFVIGQEVCDLDAVLSVIAYSYFQYKEHPNPTEIYVPLLMLPNHSDLELKSELISVLGAPIMTQLLTIEDISLDILKRSTYVLMGNYYPTTTKIPYEQVKTVFANRFYVPPKDQKNVKHIFEAVSSISTLIAKQILNVTDPWTKYSYLLFLLAPAIIVNAENMENGQGTHVDRELIAIISDKFKWDKHYRGSIYGHLTGLQYNYQDFDYELHNALHKNADVMSNKAATFRVVTAVLPIKDDLISFMRMPNKTAVINNVRTYYDASILILIKYPNEHGLECGIFPLLLDNVIIQNIIKRIKQKLNLSDRIDLDNIFQASFYTKVMPNSRKDFIPIVQKILLEAEEEFAMHFFLKQIENRILGPIREQKEAHSIGQMLENYPNMDNGNVIYVIGANTANLDVVTSTIALAYWFNNIDKSAIKTNCGFDGENHVFVPVIDFLKDQWILKKEVIIFLEDIGIMGTDLIFREDIANELHNAKQIFINRTDKTAQVVFSIDTGTQLVDNQLPTKTVGSKIWTLLSKYKWSMKPNAPLAQLLRASIILSTSNLDTKKAGKTTNSDIENVREMDALEHATLFNRLRSDKDDPTGLTPIQLLYQNVKYEVTGRDDHIKYRIAWPYISVSTWDFVLVQGGWRDIEIFATAQKLNAMILMGQQRSFAIFVFNLLPKKAKIFEFIETRLKQKVTNLIEKNITAPKEFAKFYTVDESNYVDRDQLIAYFRSEFQDHEIY